MVFQAISFISCDSHESIGRKLLGNDTSKTYISVAQGVAEEKERVGGPHREG